MSVFKYIVFSTALALSYSLGALYIYSVFFAISSEGFGSRTAPLDYFIEQGPLVLILVLIAGAGVEELFFRAIPSGISLLRSILLKAPPENIFRSFIIVAIISSAIFGILHGNYINIFFQGIVGMFLFALYLKCGGYHGNIIKAMSCSTISHALFNLAIIYLL